MAKIILFDDYIDAHTLKRQMVNNIDFYNVFGQRLLMELYGGFEYGNLTLIKGGRYGELPRADDRADFEPVPD
jgi:hypothetical protein